MATLADLYYVKALDNYPYDLELSLEYLNYALSNDQYHTGANHLMAEMYIDRLNEPIKAKVYLEKALSNDPENLNVCYTLISLFITIREFDKAEKTLSYAYKLKGADLCRLYSLDALNNEYQKKYSEALNLLSFALEESYNQDSAEFINNEISRIKDKTDHIRSVNYFTNS